METPPYLFDQFARQRGVSKEMAKRALMLQGYAGNGERLDACAIKLGIALASAKKLCRVFMIDFPDYRPYAAKEKRGEPRPAPFVRKDADPSSLPLFS